MYSLQKLFTLKDTIQDSVKLLMLIKKKKKLSVKNKKKNMKFSIYTDLQKVIVQSNFQILNTKMEKLLSSTLLHIYQVTFQNTITELTYVQVPLLKLVSIMMPIWELKKYILPLMKNQKKWFPTFQLKNYLLKELF